MTIQIRANVELSRYEFAIGNVDSELVGYRAQVIASSRTHVLHKLQAIIEQHSDDIHGGTNEHREDVLRVFFNVDDISDNDIEREMLVYCETITCNKRAGTVENEKLRCCEHCEHSLQP